MRKYVIALILIVLVFSGLDNLREIPDLAIVKAIGLDLTEEGEYKATVIVLDSTGEDEKNNGIIYEAVGESVQEAIRHIVDESPKKLYLAHMETLILSEQIAREKFENTLDFFIRDNEGSNEFFLFIANGCEAHEVIEVLNEEKIDMNETLRSSATYRGNSNTETLNDIIKNIMRPGKDISVNSCTINNDLIKIMDMAYFKGWEMQGFLEDQESIIYNMLDNNLENALVTIGTEDDLIVSEIASSKSNIKLDKEDNAIKIKIKINANISETGKNIFIRTSEDTDEIERKLAEKIKTTVDEFIQKSKNEYNSDLIGIGNLLYRKKSELFNDENYLANTNVNVEVEVSIFSQGGVIKRW